MAPACRLVADGRPVPATWRRDGDTLLVTPEGGVPLAVRLGEVAGISGDGHAIRLHRTAGEVALERLGADGPPLLADLRRDWLALRARTLRLAGELPPPRFAGAVAAGGAPREFSGAFAGDLLLTALEGGDVEPRFLARTASLRFDEQAHSLEATGWDGSRVVFSRLGARTDDFRALFAAGRERLAAGAAGALARCLPTLAPADRARLASRWIPGRLLPASDLEALVPGFAAAFASSWLAASPRRTEGECLVAATPPDRLFLGYGAADADADGAGPGGDGGPFLLLLAGAASGWLLEALSEEDFATYRFAGGDDLPALVEPLLALPEFSREALYLPLEQLAGERAAFAVPARELPLLRALREGFRGRIVHASPDAWRREAGL